MAVKTKRILSCCSVALCIWILFGAVAGSSTMPANWHEFDTKSPDGKKEFYAHRPFHRRVIKGMMYPIEWPVNLVTFVFTGQSVGSLYFADYSLYVRDIASGQSYGYSPPVPEAGAWSPDSRWIACGGTKKDERIPLVLIDTNAQKEYVIFAQNSPLNFAIENVTWSEDGNSVSFRQEYTVYAVDIVSKNIVAIANDVTGDSIDVLQIVAKWKAKAESGNDRNQATEPVSSDSNEIGKLRQVQKDMAQPIIKKLVEVNRYWLFAPNPDVHNYSYDFKLRTSLPVTYDVNNPVAINPSVRQGINYYSLLREIALHPEKTIITDFNNKDVIIRLTVKLTNPVKMHCSNGIEKKYFGSFSRPMQSGVIWIDTNKMVPLKATIGTVNEQYGNYVSAGPDQWVPLNIKVDSGSMHFDFKFNFFRPGLWLFDTSEYRLDKTEQMDAAQYHNIASISNVKINGSPAEKWEKEKGAF